MNNHPFPWSVLGNVIDVDPEPPLHLLAPDDEEQECACPDDYYDSEELWP